MWLSAIYKDLEKVETAADVDGVNASEIGIAFVERMEEGQFVVVDNDENEFMLFHPDVETENIAVPGHLASWTDASTGEWKWAVAVEVGPNAYEVDDEHHVEPEPH